MTSKIHVPPASAPAPTGVLKVQGTSLVGQDGKPVILKGAGLGGHLNMENCTPTSPLVSLISLTAAYNQTELVEFLFNQLYAGSILCLSCLQVSD